jgi:hypothetical protein
MNTDNTDQEKSKRFTAEDTEEQIGTSGNQDIEKSKTREKIG